MTVLKYSNDMFANCSLLVWQHAPLLSCVLHVNSNGIAFEQVQDYYNTGGKPRNYHEIVLT